MINLKDELDELTKHPYVKSCDVSDKLDFANKENIPYVVIIGENELNNNEISIKDMFNNSNFLLPLDNISDINISL